MKFLVCIVAFVALVAGIEAHQGYKYLYQDKKVNDEPVEKFLKTIQKISDQIGVNLMRKHNRHEDRCIMLRTLTVAKREEMTKAIEAISKKCYVPLETRWVDIVSHSKKEIEYKAGSENAQDKLFN